MKCCGNGYMKSVYILLLGRYAFRWICKRYFLKKEVFADEFERNF
jgi:hypothetical protein